MTKTLFAMVKIVLIVSMALLPGCTKTRERQLFVIVLDLTASTDPEGRAVAFEVMQGWFNKKRVRRGDTIVIIPITGDALTQTQGKVLRFKISETREIYDEDLRTLATQVKDSLKKMEREAVQNPYSNSDVLGAFRLASEELARQKGRYRKVMIALTDFIQDDQRVNFNFAPQLTNKTASMLYARRMVESHQLNFEAQVVYLGWLRSKDLKKMSPSRREALEAFLTEYLKSQGVKDQVVAMDGPGGMDRVLETAD